jgi:uncharacterized HAD superfamily protein
MNIGIDLDDTIADTAKGFLKYGIKFNKEENIAHKIKDCEWDFDKAFGWTEENMYQFFDKYLQNVFETIKPKKDAIKVINLLKKEGNKIIIITARSSKHLQGTYEICKKWFEKYKIQVDKIIIDGNDKAIECKNNKINIFIDDGIYHCEKVFNELRIPVLLMNSKYNKDYRNENIKRVFSWKEIYEEIEKIKVH